ncbi:MAG: DUF2934 domain-containing protein [Pseudomonas fluorescens]
MDEQKIREAAYRLWEKQGKPQGQDLEHWFTAEKSSGEENSDNSTSNSAPSTKDADLRPKKRRS